MCDLLDWIKDMKDSILSNQERLESRVQRLDAKYEAMEKSAIESTADASVGKRACLTPNFADNSHIAESKVNQSTAASAKADEKFENLGYTCITECLPYKIETMSGVSIDTSDSTSRGMQLQEMIVKFRLDPE